MLRYVLSVAVLATGFSVSTAHAQARPPAESPPAGFAGQQYVDSRGCVYVRAGLAGQTNWVARIDRARKPICGQTPSRQVMAAAQAELAAPVAAMPPPAETLREAGAAPAPRTYVPPPVTHGSPRPLQSRLVHEPRPEPLPALAMPQVRTAQSDVGIAPDGAYGYRRTTGGHPALVDRHTGCPQATPYGRIYPLADGRTMLLCANEPHKLRNLSNEQAQGYSAAQARPMQPHPQQLAAAGSDLMTPPPGYRAAWQDDRLNPNRAIGTAAGDQQMAQVWTTERAPQELRHPAYARPSGAPQQAVVSSKSYAPSHGRFVQIGSFAVAENADRVIHRLQAMGLPVQVSGGQIKGKSVRTVRAGPFGAPEQAQAALQAVRAAGYDDAMLRR